MHADRSNRLWIAVLVAAFALRGLCADQARSFAGNGSTPQAHPAPLAEGQFRGRVVCLPEEMHRLYQTDLPTNHEHIYAFKTTNGVYHTLLRTKLSEALFADERVREKELLLTGRVLPGTQVFDVTGMKSIHNGVVHDLYYYCELCAIRTAVPGPCVCCQAPVELTERPLDPKAP